ncbi:MAG: DUF4296 domain-containing protein [Bacteroidaceae bacterium]|nr:DUF4296 domain-containing protein [Bacteroidaceae bacterium]
MRRFDLLLLAILLPVLSGCRLNRPDDVLAPRKMEQFLYDYHLAQAIGQELPKEDKYSSKAYTDWAYHKNGITPEEFNRSLVWYTRNPKELAKIYKRLSNRLDDEYKTATRSLAQIEKKSFEIQSGDSVNLWYLASTALLNTSVYMNKLTYKINRDTTFHKGDTVCLDVTGTFVSADTCQSRYSYMSLSAYYTDSVSTSDTILRTNGNVMLSIVLDADKDFSSISGSINYLDSADNRNSILMLSDMDLMRYHRRTLPDTVRVSTAD